jgi:phosphate uptake regulator
MNSEDAFMKAINDIISTLEGIQKVQQELVERIIKLEEDVRVVWKHLVRKVGRKSNGKETSTS